MTTISFMKILFAAILSLSTYILNSQTLTKYWETDSLLQKPESAVYDSVNKVIYVSNINGEYCTKDGNGFISKVSPDGKIEELNFVTGLDSPQGLGLYNNLLFVADINKVVVIDIPNRKVVKEYVVDSAKFFNDIAVDAEGGVYVTDCKANKIYKIERGKISLWLNDPLLSGPNGLLCQQHELFVLNMGNGVAYRTNNQTRVLREFSSGIRNCDGIVNDGNDGYFVSGAWQGEVYHINHNGEKQLILNLGDKKIITADIEYIPGLKLLLIPTLKKTLLAYMVK